MSLSYKEPDGKCLQNGKSEGFSIMYFSDLCRQKEITGLCFLSLAVVVKTIACKPHRVHQSRLAARREGHEKSQGTAEDPQRQPVTYGDEEQGGGGESGFISAPRDGGRQLRVVRNGARHTCLATSGGISSPHRRFFKAGSSKRFGDFCQ